MKIEKRLISELKEWDKNPRTISKDAFDRLKYQVEKLKDYKPLLITPDNVVIGGNMRLKAYRELGIKETMVSVVDPKNENEKWEYALSDNDHVGATDSDMLANEMPNLDIEWSKYAVDIKEPTNLQELLNQFKPVEEDEAPEVAQGEAVSKLGEVYQLGRHRLMCGDSTKIEDVEKLMDGKKADMVFTDPPYGVSYVGGLGNQKKREGIIGDDKPVGDLFYNSMSNAVSITIDKASFYIFYSFDNKNALDVIGAIKNAGLRIKALLIWHKTNAGFGSLNHHYKQKHEPFFYCSKDELAENWYGPSNEVTIWDLKRDGLNEFHPTQKPVELCARAIKNSSKTDDGVLDLFGGSGSTLIACEQTNRICYMMEISEAYCDTIRRRYWKYTHNNNEDGWQEGTPIIS